MESKRHKQWKLDLFNHLDRKLSGCFLCEMEESQDSHAPAYAGGRHREPSQMIMWLCERMHPHTYDILRGAGHVVMEKYQSAPISGRCCPDLTILDNHREPIAFIEVVKSNRPTKSRRVAEELDIPLFTLLAPDRRSLKDGLHPSRPWWDFDSTLSETDKRQMDLMEQVGAELMRRHTEGNHTWSELDMLVDEDGKLIYARSRGSLPDFDGPAFPRNGNRVVAELCSWNCDKAMEKFHNEQVLDQRAAECAMRETLEQDLGQIILRTIAGAGDDVARFIVPIGSQEVHVPMSVHPLNTWVSPDDPIFLSLKKQINDAQERVRNRLGRPNPLKNADRIQ